MVDRSSIVLLIERKWHRMTGKRWKSINKTAGLLFTNCMNSRPVISTHWINHAGSFHIHTYTHSKSHSHQLFVHINRQKNRTNYILMIFFTPIILLYMRNNAYIKSEAKREREKNTKKINEIEWEKSAYTNPFLCGLRLVGVRDVDCSASLCCCSSATLTSVTICSSICIFNMFLALLFGFLLRTRDVFFPLWFQFLLIQYERTVPMILCKMAFDRFCVYGLFSCLTITFLPITTRQKRMEFCFSFSPNYAHPSTKEFHFSLWSFSLFFFLLFLGLLHKLMWLSFLFFKSIGRLFCHSYCFVFNYTCSMFMCLCVQFICKVV